MWIDDRLAQRKALSERQGLISEHAVGIYEALWDKIVEYVEEAKRRDFPLVTIGSLQNRSVVSAPAVPDGTKANQFRLLLAGAVISVQGSHINFEFTLDVCPDGIVCLKYQGERISVENAALIILDPFLFPDLQGEARRER